jgi:hypothetical protein
MAPVRDLLIGEVAASDGTVALGSDGVVANSLIFWRRFSELRARVAAFIMSMWRSAFTDEVLGVKHESWLLALEYAMDAFLGGGIKGLVQSVPKEADDLCPSRTFDSTVDLECFKAGLSFRRSPGRAEGTCADSEASL